MREIKFRAWDNYNKEMFVGTYLVDLIGIAVRNAVGEGIQPNDDLVYLQYTGLKDKSGREIYEGDILKYTRFSWQCQGHPKHNTDLVTSYEIRWSDEYSAFRTENRSMSGSLLFYDSRARKNEVEVIGNIYENPELLET